MAFSKDGKKAVQRTVKRADGGTHKQTFWMGSAAKAPTLVGAPQRPTILNKESLPLPTKHGTLHEMESPITQRSQILVDNLSEEALERRIPFKLIVDHKGLDFVERTAENYDRGGKEASELTSSPRGLRMLAQEPQQSQVFVAAYMHGGTSARRAVIRNPHVPAVVRQSLCDYECESVECSESLLSDWNAYGTKTGPKVGDESWNEIMTTTYEAKRQ